METQNALAGQALKAIFKLKSIVYKLGNISVSHIFGLFDKLIAPVINYASEIWGFAHGNAVERVHLGFCKQILGVKQQTQNNFIYGELGRSTMRNIRFFSIIRYWCKLIRCENSRFIRQIYNLMLEDIISFPNKLSWASNVKSILDNWQSNVMWHYSPSRTFLEVCLEVMFSSYHSLEKFKEFLFRLRRTLDFA